MVSKKLTDFNDDRMHKMITKAGADAIRNVPTCLLLRVLKEVEGKDRQDDRLY